MYDHNALLLEYGATFLPSKRRSKLKQDACSSIKHMHRELHVKPALRGSLYPGFSRSATQQASGTVFIEHLVSRGCLATRVQNYQSLVDRTGPSVGTQHAAQRVPPALATLVASTCLQLLQWICKARDVGVYGSLHAMIVWDCPTD